VELCTELSLYLIISVLARNFLQSGGIAWLVAMLARRQLPWGGGSHRSAWFLSAHVRICTHREQPSCHWTNWRM